MTDRSPHLAAAIPEAELIRALHELISATAVPEAERAAWHRSMQAFARREPPNDLYDWPKLAGAWLRAAAASWGRWPEQEEE